MKHFFLLAVIFFLSFISPNIYSALSLIPGGENIAFEIYPDGIIVTGSYDVAYDSGTYNPSRDSDIVKGDKIVGIGEDRVIDLKSFTSKFYRYTADGICPITVERKGKDYQRNLHLISSDSSIKTGLYVKERILGVGTASFYDPATKTYGALAHEVYDSDSESIVDVRIGNVYLEDVESITPSSDGHVGNKNCDLTFEEEIGTIRENTKFGIFGSIEEIPSSYEPIEVASWDEVRLGKASIRTCIEGDKVGEYEIDITALKKQPECDIKGISFRITDRELLAKCGGIYQGMSGSPILQNGKLVGAVTHVNIGDVDTGYGIYMQYMYQMAMA